MLKVSYLVPLYNKEDFIEECIESILQEESEQFEIEICIVDDGSLDNSLKIVQEKYGSNERVKVASFPKNKGKNAAFNKAFEISTGDYICLFGADDVIVSRRTAKLLEVSINNENKAVYGGLVAKNSDLTTELYKVLPSKPSLYSITMANGLSGGCCLIPRSLIEVIFPIPIDLKFEDWWISYALVKNDEVVILEDYVSVYRISGNNDCAFLVNNADDLYLGIKRDYERHVNYLNKLRIFDPVNEYMDKSLDLRLSFLGEKPKKIFYMRKFDIFSLKIILFYYIGAKFFYRVVGNFRK